MASVGLRLEALEERTVMATFVVNTTVDTVDANPGDGIAADASGNTSLRAAIMEHNALALNGAGSNNEIVLPGGNYLLTLPPASAPDDAFDDLDVTGGTLLIRALGDGEVFVNGNNQFRVFEIHTGATTTIRDIHITGGNVAGSGAGVLNGGTTTLERVTVFGNQTDFGGGIANDNVMTIINSTISGNSATINGGGIYNSGGTLLTIVHSTITANRTIASGQGGGIFAESTTQAPFIWNTIIFGNTALVGPDAAGLYDSLGGNLIGNPAGAGGFLPGNDILGYSGPLLLGLANYGGITRTHALDIAGANPALDTADNAAAGSFGLSSDQRSGPFVRIFNGRADIGAVEVQPPPNNNPNSPRRGIVGLVWEDLNADGRYQVGEPLVAGVTVRLLDAGTLALVGSTVTNAGGQYNFVVGLTIPYIIEFVLPGGFVFTLKDIGLDIGDSDPNQANGRTDPTAIAPPGLPFFIRLDAGLVRSIREEDPGDPGIPNFDPFDPFYQIPVFNTLPQPFQFQFRVPEGELETFIPSGQQSEPQTAYVNLYKLEQSGGRSLARRLMTLSIVTGDPARMQGLIGSLNPGKYRITVQTPDAEFVMWEGDLPLGVDIAQDGVNRVWSRVKNETDPLKHLREWLPGAAQRGVESTTSQPDDRTKSSALPPQSSFDGVSDALPSEQPVIEESAAPSPIRQTSGVVPMLVPEEAKPQDNLAPAIDIFSESTGETGPATASSWLLLSGMALGSLRQMNRVRPSDRQHEADIDAVMDWLGCGR